MKKTLLAHLHLYYIEQLDYFIDKLSNIQSIDHDLYITMTENNEDIKHKIISQFPNANILIVPNKGYDVGPFIQLLNKINIDNYEYVLKVHTKNTSLDTGKKINKIWIHRNCWMHLLVEALIGSQKIFLENIKKFKDNEKIGMIASKYLVTSSTDSYINILDQVYDTIKYLGFSIPEKLTFVAGTMFMIRASLLKPIIKHGYTIDSFEPTEKTGQDNKLAHIFERIFGVLVTSQGREIFSQKNSIFSVLFLNARRCYHFLYSKKTTKNNHTIIKICKIPVYRRSNV